MSELRADPSNAGMVGMWDGDDGDHWAANADFFDSTMARHHARLLAAADIGATERVLDIGCGTGQVTRDAARAATAGSAVGVDLSARMLAEARRRAEAEGLHNVVFQRADVQVHAFEAESFDLAVSRIGASFFGEPRVAFTNIARALRQGGRLVILSWRSLDNNEWIREIGGTLAAGPVPLPPAGAPGPFGHADPAAVTQVLESSGFAAVDITQSTEPARFGDDAEDAERRLLPLFGWMAERLDADGQARALDAFRATLAAHDTGAGVEFGSEAWIIRARRL